MMAGAPGRKQARCGINEWFALGEYRQAEQLLDDACAAGFRDIRLAVTLAQWNSPKARAWYGWLIARAAERFEVVIALHRLLPHHSHQLPPAWVHEALAYQRFFGEACNELGDSIQWLECADLLGVPSWPDASPQSAGLLSKLLCESSAPSLCLGGLVLDARWLAIAYRQGLFDSVQALAFRRFSQADKDGELAKVDEVLPAPQRLERWLTPDPIPPRRDSGIGLLVGEWGGLLNGAVERVYLNLTAVPAEGERQPGRGLRTADGKPALLGRLLQLQGGGYARVQEVATWGQGSGKKGGRDRELVIGGAGFIGCNVAARLAAQGHQILVLDDLSRPGTECNLEWLHQRFPNQIEVLLADVRDRDAVQYAVQRACRIFHFAAQVAVTTSLKQPFFDHDVNTVGTLNVLEAARRRRYPPGLVFTSTNKVYGDLDDLELQLTASGYAPVDDVIRSRGIDESRPLKFCSPYGCSKGAADQYVLDYARTLGLPATVLRMSCIYGPRQFGNEDQGWVAHFIRQVVSETPITFYGDGLQVRDVLYVDDLVKALLTAANHLPAIAGEAFNMGGGPQNVLSLQGLVDQLAVLHHRVPVVYRKDWRPSDQRYYVSDTSKFQRVTGWRPAIGSKEGVRQLYEWMQQELTASRPAAHSEKEQVVL
ncbi:NAD-dependent epimerase/dehydratase family protein [Nitrosococcus wardiae]|uniref:NAD-dependent epimerase/dehydratase family protein n=1 Tax=Nitrosococcus wardiae TaxID=1814290 RepID=A0A4P7BZS0_9GAMM|nr:NAD-dependent epimerase/dehydratase family protein [Nitrosococcus wardiae]QBQ55743.1 NAD-dependent epimerase/dehydratase family protein [Nitrosococcus wardiae]